MVATFLSMLIAGFWHGANWTYVVFGAVHGLALVINHWWKKRKWPIPDFLAWACTFTVVVVALVIFRASDMSQAWEVLASMFSLRGGLFDYTPWEGIGRVDQVTGAIWMFFGVSILIKAPSSLELEKRFKPSLVAVAAAIALATIACFYANGVVSRSFLYRDF